MQRTPGEWLAGTSVYRRLGRLVPWFLVGVLSACDGGMEEPQPRSIAGNEPPVSIGVSLEVSEVVRRHMEERRIPGAAIAVVGPDGSVQTAAFGTAVVQHDVPTRVETVFEIASLTKQFTAVAVLMLVDEGKLALDDEILDFVDDPPAAWRGLTIRQLLNHTAGLLPEDEMFVSLRNDWRKFTRRELMLASAKLDPVVSAPGEKFSYSSEGYFLAALAVERASGLTFTEFLERRIFEPLGMKNTLLQDELRIIPNEAQGYSLKDGELVNIWRDAAEEVAGGWGMFSNIPDLVRWDRALREGDLISTESYDEMFRPLVLADGSTFRYGLGWWLPERNGIPYQYHSGVTGTEILRVPSHQWTFIVLTNLGRSNSVGSGEANPWGLADGIASAMLPEFALRVVDLPLGDDSLADYTGHWRFGYGDARFFVRDGHLWIDDQGGTGEMLFQGDETFSFEGDNERLQFTRDASGALIGARWFSDTDVDDLGVPLLSSRDG